LSLDINQDIKKKRSNKDKWMGVMEGLYDEIDTLTSKQYVNGGIYYINKGKHKDKFCLIAKVGSTSYRYFYNNIYFRFLLNEEGENLIFIKMLAGK
jgi:hypothetical protein